MKKRKNMVAVILGLVMCLTMLAACGGNSGTDAGSETPSAATTGTPGTTDAPSASSTPVSGQEPVDAPPPEGARFAEHIEVIMDNNTVGTLNPMSPASGTPSTNHTFTMIHDRLLNYSIENGEYRPSLATEWGTDDYQTFTFKLREDVYFHNGDKLTAHDVVYTANLGKEALGSNAYTQWSVIDTARAVEDYVVEFVTHQVFVDFYYNLCMPMSGILNERAISADPDLGAAVGTGAFKLAGFAPGDFVSVERNDDYWGEIPITKSLTIRFVPEVAARTIMMLNGEAQVCMGLSAEDVFLFQREPDNYTVTRQEINNPQGISFNMTDPITGDYNFRMAVIHAMDKAAANTAALGEWWKMPDGDGSFWGQYTEFRNTSIPHVPYDTELAKEYLAKSSYNGEVVQIAVALFPNLKIMEVVQQNLREIGITTELVQMDAPSLNALFSAEPNRSQIIMHGLQFTLVAASARQNFLPGGSQNRASYNNPEVTELLNEAASTFDKEERGALYMRVQEIVAEERPYDTVHWLLLHPITVKGIGGLYIPPDSHWIDYRGIFWAIDD